MGTAPFEFSTAGRIVFGAGALREAGPALAGLGRHPLIVSGRDEKRAAPLLELLARERLSVGPVVTTAREPRLDDALEAARRARKSGCDAVVAIGGGSAIDLGKAAAALATNSGDPYDYLEVVGRGQPLAAVPLPIAAIPTTAGAGSEATRNAVLSIPAAGVKVSLRSPLLLPRLAVVDPDLALDLPREVTASTGLDALAQLIEPFVSTRATPLTDALCLDGMRRVARSLERACDIPHDRDARADMALASLMGGIALANAGLGAVHGFAGPIGGRREAPHGAVCAALLPHVTRANIEALSRTGKSQPALARFTMVAETITGRAGAKPDDAVGWLMRTNKALGIPGLSAYGLTRADFPELVHAAARASSMKGNPVALDRDELARILEAAL